MFWCPIKFFESKGVNLINKTYLGSKMVAAKMRSPLYSLIICCNVTAILFFIFRMIAGSESSSIVWFFFNLWRNGYIADIETCCSVWKKFVPTLKGYRKAISDSIIVHSDGFGRRSACLENISAETMGIRFSKIDWSMSYVELHRVGTSCTKWFWFKPFFSCSSLKN